MITQNYQFPAKTRQVELEVKRSKFLTFVTNADDRAQAEVFIRNLREQHPQANHVCWAYIAGAPNTTIRSMSDDGEPSGTAGMPMLKILEYSGYGDIVVAVVRYFGGTKLGTGGLVKAYSDAVKLVVGACPREVKRELSHIKLICPYDLSGRIEHLCHKHEALIDERIYANELTLALVIPTGNIPALQTDLGPMPLANILPAQGI